VLVESWSNPSRPDFSAETKREASKVTGYVIQDGEPAEQSTKGLTVWQLLTHGTRVRYMQLSDDWESKTSAYSAFSGPGKGVKLGIDTDDPHAGIAMRAFDESIAKEYESEFERLLEDGYDNAFARGI